MWPSREASGTLRRRQRIEGLIRIREEGWTVRSGKECVQEEGGRDPVDTVFPVDPVRGCLAPTLSVEQGVRLPGREPLVEKVVGELRMLGEERLGEGQRFCRLRTPGTVRVERIADDEGCHLVFPDEARDGFEVGAKGGAVDGEERMRGQVEGVRYGEADAAVADVQREDAAGGHGDECTGSEVRIS